MAQPNTECRPPLQLNSSGSFINGALASATTIADLGLTLKQINKLKIGLKDDSKYIGVLTYSAPSLVTLTKILLSLLLTNNPPNNVKGAR